MIFWNVVVLSAKKGKGQKRVSPLVYSMKGKKKDHIKVYHLTSSWKGNKSIVSSSEVRRRLAQLRSSLHVRREGSILEKDEFYGDNGELSGKCLSASGKGIPCSAKSKPAENLPTIYERTTVEGTSVLASHVFS